MDQVKIGKFIASLRKEKNMTQEQFAQKMGVSINAVSKWERGINFPDVSLFKKLCNELNISIEELINGEKDNSDEAKEKAIITSIKDKEKMKKKNKKIFIISSILFLIVINFLIIYNLKMKVNLVNDSNYLYDEVIEFLKKKEFKENPDVKYKDFNVFYSYYGFGIEKSGNYKYVYMWIYNGSYYIENEEYGGALASSSSSSMPIKAIFKNNILQEIIYPKDGDEYTFSIRKMFPKIIAHQVLNFDKDKNINKLYNEVEKKKNIYYNYLNVDVNKITLDDLAYGDLLFSIRSENTSCIPLFLNVYKNNKYVLYTKYKACKKWETCLDILEYADPIKGKYDFDLIEIIRHSTDANLHSYITGDFSNYTITSGKGYTFTTDDDNKYLKDFLKSLNINLKQCAQPKYNN